MEAVRQFFRRFYACEYMVKEKDVVGPLPTTREGYRLTFSVAWPSIIETVMVSLISSVDTMMVGGIGPEAIAAVGITNQPRFIVMALLFALNAGITAVIARRKGENNMPGANRCLKQCILIISFLSIFLSMLGVIFATPLMKFAGADTDILASAASYFKITMIGVPFTALSLGINAAQRGCGKTKISLTTNLSANIVNAIFNFFLINGIFFFPELGVDGAAIATVLGNVTAFGISLFSVCKPRDAYSLDITGKDPWRFEKRTLQSVINVSSSSMVEQIFVRVGFFMCSKLVAELGTLAFATNQICSQVFNISFAIGDGFSIAASSLVGQNLGAKRPDLAKLYGSVSQRIAFVASTGLFFLFFLGKGTLVSLFTDDAAVIAESAVLMNIIACTTHFQTSQLIISGCLRGAGDNRYVAVTSFISLAIVRPGLTWLLGFPLGLGLVGTWTAQLIDQILRLTVNFIRFRGNKWTKIVL